LLSLARGTKLVTAVLLAVLICAAQVRAAGVVSTCNEASLDAALVGGGSVIFTCSGTITLTNSKIIAVSTTVDGTGQGISLDHGSSGGRHFTVNSGAALTLIGLTVTNGVSGAGGAVNISAGGSATITNCTFSGNQANIDLGGAIHNSGTANISNSVFSTNLANHGGAIYNLGTTTISNSTFSGNQASLEGGAIYINSGTTTVSNSTFSGNMAGFGGAISDHSASSSITNSTFSANQGQTRAGAIYVGTGGGPTIINSTFSANSSNAGTTTYILVNGSLTIRNSILFGASGNDCVRAGFLVDGGYNLSKDTSCNLTGTGSVQSVTAQQFSLGALAVNGGPTKTILPGNSSIALNAIPASTNGCATTVTTDQRGIARPQRGACDVGAVEVLYRVPPRVISE
jgi:predicted outer membrane repeat protein